MYNDEVVMEINDKNNVNKEGETMEKKEAKTFESQKKSKSEISKIEFRPTDMKGVSKTAFTTTNTISQSITQVLQNVSDDVVACVVYVKPTGIMANLVLENRRRVSGKSKFVVPYGQITQDAERSLFNQMKNSTKPKHWLSLTEDAKVKLEDFIPDTYNGKSNFISKSNVNWSVATKEFTERAGGYGGVRLFMAVQFDLIKWFKSIYGTRNKETGSTYDYIISPIRPKQTVGAGYPFNKNIDYVVSITQCDISELRRAYETTTGMSSNNFMSFYAF